MEKIKLPKLKPLKASEKKRFTFENKTYDWDVNYDLMIELRFNKFSYSYDKDNKANMIDGTAINEVMYYEYINCFKKFTCDEGIYLTNEKQIRNAITKKCKMNTFSTKKAEKDAEKEAEKLARKAEKEARKAEKEARKAEKETRKADKEARKNERMQELPNIIHKYIKDTYGNMLEYNNTKKQVYYNNHMMNNSEIAKIQDDVERNVVNGPYALKKLKFIIEDVAKLKTYTENIAVDNVNDDDFNILKDVDESCWETYINTDKKGNMQHSIYNYMLYLCFHPQFRGKITMNAFDKIEYLQRYDKTANAIVKKPIDDQESDNIKVYIEKYFEDCNERKFSSALNNVLLRNSYHPIKEMLYSVKGKWDGVPRVRNMMVKYFGCDDVEPIHEMTEVMMCGAYQRIMEELPDKGCAFDFMGIIFGIQGSGKSKFFTRLFGDTYTVINPDVNDDQKFVDVTNKAWLVLFDEMKAINKADMPTVKSRITEQGSTVRLSYGRRSKYYPRHCVYWGNTNYPYILRDEGYERRFLCFESHITETDKHDVDWWEENYNEYIIHQLWAETGEIYEKKYKNKIIQISVETELYNRTVQLRHKVYNDDSKTELVIKSIFDYKNYDKFLYFDKDYRIWCIENDNIHKNGDEKTGGFPLNIINKKWICVQFNRKPDWIDGIITNLDWHIEQVEDPEFGTGYYYVRNGYTYRQIKDEYDKNYKVEYNSVKYNNLPADDLFFGLIPS